MDRLPPTTSPLAGTSVPVDRLVDIPRLVSAYYTERVDPANKEQEVIFGTSGHRGSSLNKTFNEAHILAITYAIILFRIHHHITGPLFLGIDTHALSIPAFITAMEVLAAHDVNVIIASQQEYTPTPAISHAILMYNQERKTGYADGIIITPSHNPPQDGGFKYNPPDGGPAETLITTWIQDKANAFLHHSKAIKRKTFSRALTASTTHEYDFLNAYINDLDNVLNMQAIAAADLRIGVHPMGGAGTHYWERIAERYHLNLDLLSREIDPAFRFMALDWDGQIRMDPSSSYAMAHNLQYKDNYDLLLLCDTDYDRHGIITPGGLMPSNPYLCAAAAYLFQHRADWPVTAALGKTIVCSQMMDKVAASMHRKLYEVPVGFKWFGSGLLNNSLGFAGEESAGASFLRRNGKVWTTDKDGIICTLLAAEMKAISGKNPALLYQELEAKEGEFFYKRLDYPVNLQEKICLQNISEEKIASRQLAGDPLTGIMSKASGNAAAISGIKIMTEKGWFAFRPSGTEAIYKLYAESFKSEAHLDQIIGEAQEIIDGFLKEYR